VYCHQKPVLPTKPKPAPKNKEEPKKEIKKQAPQRNTGGVIIPPPRVKVKPISSDGLVTLEFSKEMEFPKEWYLLSREGAESVQKLVDAAEQKS
jgi:hypothetical protein